MSPAPLPAATALYAGLIGLLLVVLAALVSRLRRKLMIGIGDGGSREMQRSIRAHANAVEWAVPALVLLLVAELNRAPLLLVHGCGIAIVVGRVLHAIGLSRNAGVSFGRLVGSALSWGAVTILALWCVWAFARLALA
jgi:uncharacterized membrane protein YecN with MAPEG domain